jgi:hypothetical protein
MIAHLLALSVIVAPTKPPIEEARRHIDRLEYDQALIALQAARASAGGDAEQLAVRGSSKASS